MASVAAQGVTVQDAYRYCRDLTKARAKNFYYAFLPLPPRRRHAIYAAYAFSRASDDYSDEAIETERKIELLAQHRRRLHETYEGAPSGPVFTALADAAQRFHIPRQYFDGLLDGMVMDLQVSRYETFEDLRRYCYLVASVIGLMSIEIFGYSGERAKEYAEDLGIAMQLVNIMRDVAEDAERGRVYLPQQELRQFGYTEEELMRGVCNEAFIELMKFQARRARDYFQRGARLLPLVPLRSRGCPAILRALYTRVLARIEARGYNVFAGRVSLRAREKLWLAGRTWTTTLVTGLLPHARPSS